MENVADVIADISDYQSLVEIAKRTRLILNTVGPYNLYGEPVIKAWLEVKHFLKFFFLPTHFMTD